MQSKAIHIPGMSGIDFAVTHVDLDAASPLNHNESHIHEACEIYLNLSGDVSFEVEGRIYPISRGSVIITRPYEYHHCIYHSDCPHEHFWITFSSEEGQSFLEMFFLREKGIDNLISLEEAQLEEFQAVLRSLLNEETDNLQKQIDCLQLFRILRAGKRESHIRSLDTLPQDVANALRYMDAHLSEDLGIQELCSASNVSISTLERHFRETLQMTPFAVLRKKRLFASMNRLRAGVSVAEAALESGFSDYSNYIQLFRKQFGLTPFAYKRKFELK